VTLDVGFRELYLGVGAADVPYAVGLRELYLGVGAADVP